MQLSVQHNIMAVLPQLERFTSRQAPFAIAKALTSTAKLVQAGVTAALPTAFDRPNAFTRRAFAIKPARKDTLEAIVFAKDAQARYLRFGVQGGVRKIKGFEKRFGADTDSDEQAGPALLPTRNVKLDASGNVSLATIKRMALQGSNGGKASRYFIGKPTGAGKNAGRSYAIYMRSANNAQISAQMVFAAQPAYKTKLDMPAIGRRIIASSFDIELRKAWAQALATAR